MRIAFVLFPNLTQLDLTAPLQVMHRIPGSTIYLLARTMDPVPSDCGLSLVPTGTFAQAPLPDLLCIPGGYGVSQAIEDAELMDYVRRSGEHSKYLTSVCTGAFVLGVAGLLQGRRATTHWAYHHLLNKVGAVPTAQRVVRDGNVITGGGVTAGLDFAFSVVDELAGTEWSQRIQLALEYRPQPPAFPSLDDPAMQPTIVATTERTGRGHRAAQSAAPPLPRRDGRPLRFPPAPRVPGRVVKGILPLPTPWPIPAMLLPGKSHGCVERGFLAALPTSQGRGAQVWNRER